MGLSGTPCSLDTNIDELVASLVSVGHLIPDEFVPVSAMPVVLAKPLRGAGGGAQEAREVCQHAAHPRLQRQVSDNACPSSHDTCRFSCYNR